MSEEETKTQEQEQQQTTAEAANSQGGQQGSGCDCTKEVTKAVQSYQKLLSKRDNDIASLKTQIEDLREKLAEANAEIKELGGTVKQVDELRGALTQREQELKRLKLVMSKFPDLVEFEAAGALPTADTEEELMQKLEAFRNLVLTKAKAEAAKRMHGVFPSNEREKSGGDGISPNLSDEKLIEMAFKAQKARNTEQYNKIMEILASRS